LLHEPLKAAGVGTQSKLPPSEQVALGDLPEGGIGLGKVPEAATDSTNYTNQKQPPISRLVAASFVQLVEFVADSLMPPERQAFSCLTTRGGGLT
jgi:hypothetical protein